ncbi:MAG: MucR family transcriptional regulator, partial [Janthinobacterium lividum]
MNQNVTTLLELTAQTVSAHCGMNTVPAEDLPALIRKIYAALSSVDGRPEDAAA